MRRGAQVKGIKERYFHMKSLHARFLSLGMALAMLLCVSGCTISTPATVGSIGGVEIPAGIYLLAQYNAYQTVSGLADLATGETADDVKAVLKAECTGTIGDEEVTTDGADYLQRLTMRDLQRYAAVEAKFAELGATLEDAATAEAADTAASKWESDGDVYKANGISQATLEQYELNSAKADACLELIYGDNGQSPVTDQEYIDYLNNECRYVDVVQLPLFDSASYAFADEDQSNQIKALAEDCAATLNGWAAVEQGRSERFTSMYEAAEQYVPQAMEILGATPESGMGAYYVGSQLLTPDTLSSYGTALTDALDAAGKGVWTTVDLGMSIGVMCDIDPLVADDLQSYKDNYDLLNLLKGDELQDQFYADGAAMEQNLDASAMKTYAASKIKTTA